MLKVVSRVNQAVRYLFNNPLQIFPILLSRTRYFRFLRDTATHNDYISLNYWFNQKILGYNQQAYWPVHKTSRVVGAQNILIGVGTNPGYNPGCYIQGTGKLYLGDYTTVGQNSGILSGGHSPYDHRIYTYSETRVGSYCWIGMNSVILPGVVLGDFTIVASGSVVTKSFEEGYCIIGGVPAKKIKDLDKNQCVYFEYENQYHGYIKKQEFESYRRKKLNI